MYNGGNNVGRLPVELVLAPPNHEPETQRHRGSEREAKARTVAPNGGDKVDQASIGHMIAVTEEKKQKRRNDIEQKRATRPPK